MADQTFPGVHTTTTTVTSTNTTVQTDIRYDPAYVRTVPGMIKCAQIVLNFLGFVCISLSIYSNTGRGSFFSSVSGFGFWFTAILLALYVFHLIEKFHMIPWLKVEFIYCAIWALLYLIASTLAAALTGHSAAFGCAASKYPLGIEEAEWGNSPQTQLAAGHLAAALVSISLLVISKYHDPEINKVFFGFCAMVLYGYDAFLKYEGIRSGQIAQGERHVAKSTSTVASPAY